MKTAAIQPKSVRRVLLSIIGIGAVSAAATTTAQASGNIFAGQFLDKAAKMEIPDMVYSPEMQVMVDPVTLVPIYQKNDKFKFKTAKVTAGCDDCPKYDSP